MANIAQDPTSQYAEPIDSINTPWLQPPIGFLMDFLSLHVEETYVSLWHIILWKPHGEGTEVKKVSKKKSQSYRSKPGAEANQLIVLFSRSHLQRDIRNHYRAAKQKVKETPNPCIKHQFRENTLAEGPMSPRAGTVDLWNSDMNREMQIAIEIKLLSRQQTH